MIEVVFILDTYLGDEDTGANAGVSLIARFPSGKTVDLDQVIVSSIKEDRWLVADVGRSAYGSGEMRRQYILQPLDDYRPIELGEIFRLSE